MIWPGAERLRTLFRAAPRPRWQEPLPPPPLQPLLLWQSLALFWLLGLLACRWPLASLLCTLLLLFADSRLWRPLMAATALALGLLGFWVNSQLLPQRPAALPDWALHGTVPLHGTVDSVQGLPDGRWRVLLRNLRSAAQPDLPPAPGLTLWTWDQPDTAALPLGQSEPLPGQTVIASLPLRDTLGFRNVGEGDSGEYWETRGVFWRLWSRGARTPLLWEEDKPDHALALARARLHLKEKLVHTFSTAAPQGTLTQGQAFIPALLFGDRFYVSSETMRRMSAASLVHSLALSGQHLALAGLAGALLVWGVGLVRPQFFLRVARPKLLVLCCLPPALLYLWLGAAPPSLLRAFAMLVLLAVFLWRNKPRTLGDILLTALVCISVAQPLAVFDTGLQLSVLCVGSMALTLPALRRAFPSRLGERRVWSWRKPARALFQILGISLAIQLALMPVSLLYFNSVSPWFFLNVLWLPVLGLWVLPVAALSLALLAPGLAPLTTLATLLLPLAVLPCETLLSGLDWLARGGWLDFPALLRPHWTSLPGWAALLTALALLPGRWKNNKHVNIPPAALRLAVAGCVLLLLGPALRHWHTLTAPLTLEMLDVGQGQALRLVLPGGESLLIDGGGGLSPRFDPGQALVAPRLARNAAPRLHSVISSHPDVDHARGLIHILRSFSVSQFLHNGEDLHPRDAALLGETAAKIPTRTLHAGMVLTLPSRDNSSLQLEVLHPPQSTAFTDNNNSLVLRLTRNGHGLALLTGDVELSALKHLLASGQNLQADVLVLPHHGSRRSLLPAFYEAVQPRLALASAGRSNRFGFPAAEVRAALQKRGVPLYSTDTAGALTVTWPQQGEALLHQIP